MKLNRSQFFAFLIGLIPGLAKAQEGTSTGGIGVIHAVSPRLPPGTPGLLPEWRYEKAFPNQCPTCGTLAKPYDTKVGSGRYRVNTETENLVRCQRCNAAFWQDSE